MPEGCEEGIIKGMYKFKTLEAKSSKHRVQLFGSGAIMMSVIKAQEILAEKYNISSDLWSLTSYNELRRDADQCRRWNMLHPTETPKKSYIETVMEGSEGPCHRVQRLRQSTRRTSRSVCAGRNVRLGN